MTPVSLDLSELQVRHHVHPLRRKELEAGAKFNPGLKSILDFLSREERQRNNDQAHEKVKALTPRSNGGGQRDKGQRPFTQKPKIIFQPGEEGDVEPIDWVWLYWLAKGKFHLLAGAPGTGKTTIAIDFAATISAGSDWPGGKKARAGNALIWSSEDDITDTLKPRLWQMGADLKRIRFVTGHQDETGRIRPFNPATDIPLLSEAAQGISGGAD